MSLPKKHTACLDVHLQTLHNFFSAEDVKVFYTKGIFVQVSLLQYFIVEQWSTTLLNPLDCLTVKWVVFYFPFFTKQFSLYLYFMSYVFFSFCFVSILSPSFS